VLSRGSEVRLVSRLCENPVDAMILLLNRRGSDAGFVQGADRQQTTLLPECLDDWVDESNSIRAVIESASDVGCGSWLRERRPSSAADLGLFNFQQRISEDCRSTSKKCHNQISLIIQLKPGSVTMRNS
jgi:hypothetical protein